MKRKCLSLVLGDKKQPTVKIEGSVSGRGGSKQNKKSYMAGMTSVGLVHRKIGYIRT